jgi:hypothetical protein
MKSIKCTAARHSWAPVGGCRENPGYMSVGGAAIQYTEKCRHCGVKRNRISGDVSKCANKNHGWRYAR